MRRNFLLSSLALLSLSAALIGCGGGDGGTSEPTPSPGPYTVAMVTGSATNSGKVQGYKINSAGQIAGSLGGSTDLDAQAAFLSAGSPPRAAPGYAYSFLHGLNEAGQGVGSGGDTAVDGRDVRQAFVFENGAVRPLAALFSKETAGASDINESGQIVGSSIDRRTAIDTVHAVMWENGQVRDLGVPEGYPNASFLSAQSINDSGQIVGNYSAPVSTQRAFLYADGRMRELPALVQGGNTTIATAINNAGQVVGWSASNSNTTGNVYNRAVMWENGVPRSLGVLAIGSPDDDYSNAQDINNRGQVVGGSSDHAYVYENGTMTDLHAYAVSAYPTATKSEGVSINDNGQILVAVVEGGSKVSNRLIVLNPR